MSYNPPRLLIGEWTFAGAAFPDFQPDSAEYLKECELLQVSARYFMNIRDKVPAFIDRIAREIIAEKPKIVGCSCLFQQHCASLAVLKRVKSLRPEIITMMGGGLCEGSMGLITHQCFEWVDYIVSGEADETLPDLCKKLIHGDGISQEELPAGVLGPDLRRSGYSLYSAERLMVHDLDSVPVPDYDDYFEILRSSTLADRIQPGLSFETSRGCWWGQRQQCTFCGNSDHAREYRAKSAACVLSELETLSKRYGIHKFSASDMILDRKYYDTLLPELSSIGKDYIFFFDTIADITRSHVKLMSDAGIRCIQPGIENLHDRILALMNKGTRAWKNIQLLKWCLEYGIFVSWNFLINVPGDEEAWYLEMSDWLPMLAHLQAPRGYYMIRFDRYSRFHREPARFKLDLKPLDAYSVIYPLSAEQLHDFAYYFDDVSPQSRNDLNKKIPIFQSLSLQIDIWQQGFYAPRPDIIKKEISPDRPKLAKSDNGAVLHITDTRPCAVQREVSLEGLTREIYLACDEAPKTEDLIQSFLRRDGPRVSSSDIRKIIDHLIGQKILLQIDDRVIGLAVNTITTPMYTSENDPSGLVIFPRAKKAE